ncbi:MAG: HutD family protein [Phenylobacterium sp.]|uniref:HutD/Ves family protein n=1 Tax=Phenylobacterium sp. TaxID=1871053 RepID=UPI0011FC3917|nr:HutD family protein [Phenylobacterium sp.]TAJ68814.1 MAG: HutD family protein [Phenylobacterium sp.]
MTLSVLRAADRAAVPWKNGGGVTREIAAWPPGSGFDDFAWRISMAEVREDGPFSSFPGIDRVLTVLEGALRLTVQDAGVFDLSPCSAPLAFDGAALTSAQLTAGPVLDLNVMTRRGAAIARVDRVTSHLDLPPMAAACLVFALADGVEVHSAGEFHQLDRYDGVLSRTVASVEASAEAQAIVVWLTISDTRA